MNEFTFSFFIFSTGHTCLSNDHWLYSILARVCCNVASLSTLKSRTGKYSCLVHAFGSAFEIDNSLRCCNKTDLPILLHLSNLTVRVKTDEEMKCNKTSTTLRRTNQSRRKSEKRIRVRINLMEQVASDCFASLTEVDSIEKSQSPRRVYSGRSQFLFDATHSEREKTPA